MKLLLRVVCATIVMGLGVAGQTTYGYPPSGGYGYPPGMGYGYPPSGSYGYPPNLPSPMPGPSDDGPRLGVIVRPFPGGGVLLVDVMPDSLALDLGLQPGFRVLTVNGQLVYRAGDIRSVLASANDYVSVVFQTPDGAYYQADSSLSSPMQWDDERAGERPAPLRAARVQVRPIPPPRR